MSEATMSREDEIRAMSNERLKEIQERAGVYVQCDSRCGCIGVYQGEKVNCFHDVSQFEMYIARPQRGEGGEYIHFEEDERRAIVMSQAWNDRIDLLAEVERLRREKTDMKSITKEALYEYHHPLGGIALGPEYFPKVDIDSIRGLISKETT